VAHEGIGGAFLASLGLPHLTTTLVKRHVDAKRYLCSVDPSYHGRLSEASKTTLQHQGGPMSAQEAAEFEQDPLKATILQMRSWDEAAKDPDAKVPSLESYREMLESLLSPVGSYE
jgi:predicted HD phosphohydrolase